MDELPPPVTGFNWGGLRYHVERVEEMLLLARGIGKDAFEVECIPEGFVGQVAEIFRDQGCEVLRGRNRLKVVINGR